MELRERGYLVESGKTPAVQFMDEFWSKSEPHPFDRRQRIYEGMLFEIGPFSKAYENYETRIHISSVASLEPRKGWGTRAMKLLIKLAKKHGVTLDGTVSPIERRDGTGLKKRELMAWYKRLGFKKDKRGKYPDPDGIVLEP